VGKESLSNSNKFHLADLGKQYFMFREGKFLKLRKDLVSIPKEAIL
jgi:hypothetical protein